MKMIIILIKQKQVIFQIIMIFLILFLWSNIIEKWMNRYPLLLKLNQYGEQIQSSYTITNDYVLKPKEYEKAKAEYLKKLDAWDKEHLDKADKDKAKYYDGERCLKTRLRECVDDHLRFLTDFRIDFTNNLAERGLRKIKTKLKIAGGFRNLLYGKYYCKAISIIDTCKKQNMNIGETIKSIFMGKKKIFVF